MEKEEAQQDRARVRRRLTKAERSAHLAAWKRSGQSARAYGQAHGIASARLYAWNSKLKTTAAGQPLAEGNGPAFVPVRIRGLPTSSGCGSITVTVRSGELEFAISGATEIGELIGVIGCLKKEVLDV